MNLSFNGHRISLDNVEKVSSLSVSVADSFVKYNKMLDSGSGESKLYVGPLGDDKPPCMFFGDEFIKNGASLNAFFLKEDLLFYLETAENEYKNDEYEIYKNQGSMSNRYDEYLEIVKKFDDQLDFFIKLHIGIAEKERCYINGYSSPEFAHHDTKYISPYFDFLRCILLPFMSKIQIVKLYDSSRKEYYFWFRPYIYEFTKLVEPNYIVEEVSKINSNINLTPTEKYNLVQARIGQGKYKKDLLSRFSEKCCISSNPQIEILEASHIKPWASSNNEEKIDKFNGLLLTKNIHKLFDLGFISISDQCELLISSFVTAEMKREIEKGKNHFNKIKKEISKSQKYLQYHRDEIYRE